MVRITTRVEVSRSSPVIRRVASTPSISGMRMSIRTTSGRSRTASSTAAAAVGGLADDLDVVGGAQQDGEAAPHERLVVGDRHPDQVERVRAAERRELELQTVAEQLEQLERRRRSRGPGIVRAGAAPVSVADSAAASETTT